MNDFILNQEITSEKNLNSKTLASLIDNFKLNQTILKESLRISFIRFSNLQNNYFKNCLIDNLNKLTDSTSSEIQSSKEQDSTEFKSALQSKLENLKKFCKSPNSNEIEPDLYRTFYASILNNLKNNIFNLKCICESKDKSCLFCQLLRQDDETSPKSNDHSYCKLTENENVDSQVNSEQVQTKPEVVDKIESQKVIQSNLAEKKMFDEEFYIDFDDGLLNNLIKERLNLMFTNVINTNQVRRAHSDTKVQINSGNSRKLLEQSYEEERLFYDDIRDHDVSLELDNNVVKVKNLTNKIQKPSICKSRISFTNLNKRPRKRAYSVSSKQFDLPAAKKFKRKPTTSTLISSHLPVITNHANGYNLSFSSDKYDINNIIIPSEHLNTCAKINLTKAQNVPVPKWRQLVLETTCSTTDLEIEEKLENSIFENRHELAELKERYHVLYKKLEKQKKNKLDSTSQQICLEEFKALISKVKNEEDKRKLNNHLNSHVNKLLNEQNSLLNVNTDETDLLYTNENTNDGSVTSTESVLSMSKKATEWPPRLFPLDEQEYDEMIQIDNEQQDKVKSYISNRFISLTKRKNSSSSRKSSFSISNNQESSMPIIET